MKCVCKEEMKMIDVWDDPDINIAFNLYMCGGCGTICRQDVWDNKGITFLTHNAFKTFAKLSKQVLDA